MSKAATRKNLQRNAPAEDREEPALAAGPTHRDPSAHSTYNRVALHARTLDELREKLEDHGLAAVAEVHWGAILTWLMRDGNQLSSMPRGAASAVRLCRDHDRARLSHPLNLRKPVQAAFNDLSPQSQCEAERIATQIVTAWEQAGCPYLDVNRICDHHRFIENLISLYSNQETAA